MLEAKERLRKVVNLLLENFHHLGEWWPYEESKEEIIITAILTQNTTWDKAEKGFSELKKYFGTVKVEAVASWDLSEFENIIKTLGFYKSKAKTIKDVCQLIVNKCGGFNKCLNLNLGEFREKLLSIKGIGEETADSILLYAFDMPSFVVDNYTVRILNRFLPYDFDKNRDYNKVKSLIEEFVFDVREMKILHGAFVEIGKRFCKKNHQICNNCPLHKECNHYTTFFDFIDNFLIP